MRPIIGVNGDCLRSCGDVRHSPPSSIRARLYVYLPRPTGARAHVDGWEGAGRAREAAQ
jgi:hypothetical protein